MHCKCRTHTHELNYVRACAIDGVVVTVYMFWFILMSKQKKIHYIMLSCRFEYDCIPNCGGELRTEDKVSRQTLAFLLSVRLKKHYIGCNAFQLGKVFNLVYAVHVSSDSAPCIFSFAQSQQ